MTGIRLLAHGAMLGVAAAALGQGLSVVDSVHNLSASGPGQIRASSEPEVCIFCHTPHNAAPIQPLWNRRSPLNAYTVYSSTSLDAKPGQPTGPSKMCLSCHDGTIALGAVLSRDQPISMMGGVLTMPEGAANLGTDLSDDHPISFDYTSSLAFQDGELRDPTGLPDFIRLGGTGEMHCTSCHDAHDNSFGDFLVMSNEDSALCYTCHQNVTTQIDAHRDCRSCHTSHTSPSGPFLLRETSVTPTCLRCHSGGHHDSRAADILADLVKVSTHDTNSSVSQLTNGSGHSSCTDCHDPHTMESGAASSTGAHPNMGRVAGVSISGSRVDEATFEHEVCFKCHGDDNVIRRPTVPRVITQLNTRLEFAPSAISFHPIAAPGRNPDVPSLRPGWSESSVMQCSDCHGSDSSRKAGRSGPDGVHGSNEPPILIARYDTMDYTPESASAYALCYTCHYREGPDGILADRSFPHSVHVVDSRTPCSACHDAHGISSVQGRQQANSHLINFDNTIVFPLQGTGQIQFQDQGMFSGSCTLTCHGSAHVNRSYQQ